MPRFFWFFLPLASSSSSPVPSPLPMLALLASPGNCIKESEGGSLIKILRDLFALLKDHKLHSTIDKFQQNSHESSSSCIPPAHYSKLQPLFYDHSDDRPQPPGSVILPDSSTQPICRVHENGHTVNNCTVDIFTKLRDTSIKTHFEMRSKALPLLPTTNQKQ